MCVGVYLLCECPTVYGRLEHFLLENICQRGGTNHHMTQDYEYDDKGHITKIIHPAIPGEDGNTLVRPTEGYKYEPQTGDKIEYTATNGNKTFYDYDGYHNLITVTRPLNGMDHVVEYYEYYTDNTYPIKGLLKKEIPPFGDNDNCTRYEYNINSTLSYFDPMNAMPSKTVRSIQRISGVNHVSVSEFDAAGRLVTETTPTGVTSVNHYNLATGLLVNREIFENSLSAQPKETTSYQYDPFGNEEKATLTYPGSDIIPIVTESAIDPKNGNLLSETDSDDTKIEYEYDKDGNESSMEEIDSEGYTLAEICSDYDVLGRLTEEIIVDGKGEAPTDKWNGTYEYKNVDRKLNISSSRDEYGGVTYIETDYDGRLVYQKTPNGLQQKNTYYIDGQVKREEYLDVNNNLLKWTEYVYDDWGRLIKETSSFDGSGNAEKLYTYDIVGNMLAELVKVDVGKYSKTSYGYDHRGNRTRTTVYEGFFNASGVALDNKPASHSQILYDWDGQVLLESKGLANMVSTTTLKNGSMSRFSTS